MCGLGGDACGCGGDGGGGGLRFLDRRVGAESGEEVGEEGAVGGHGCLWDRVLVAVRYGLESGCRAVVADKWMRWVGCNNGDSDLESMSAGASMQDNLHLERCFCKVLPHSSDPPHALLSAGNPSAGRVRAMM